MVEMPGRKYAVGSSSSSAQYHRLNSSKKEGYSDLQFERPLPKVPYKAITFAVILFVIGSGLLIIGSLLFTGYIDAKYSDRTWPLLIFGFLLFIPGVYHVRIACYAYKHYDGYSYEDIPELE